MKKETKMFCSLTNKKQVSKETAALTFKDDMAIVINVGDNKMLSMEMLEMFYIFGKAAHQPFPGLKKLVMAVMADNAKTYPLSFQPMQEGSTKGYFVTNGMPGGAACILYPGFMKEAYEKMGGDFWIIPEHQDEVIILKDDGTFTPDQLQEMVGVVNFLLTKQFNMYLSDTVLHCDGKHIDTIDEWLIRKVGIDNM